MILGDEQIFHELKRLADKQPSKNTDTSMEMPRALQKCSKTNLVSINMF